MNAGTLGLAGIGDVGEVVAVVEDGVAIVVGIAPSTEWSSSPSPASDGQIRGSLDQSDRVTV